MKGIFNFTTTDKSTGKNEDIKKKCISDSAKCIKYFTNVGFSEILNNKDVAPNNDYIDKLSKAYKDDLGNVTFDSPLIFVNPESKTFHQLFHQGIKKVIKIHKII